MAVMIGLLVGWLFTTGFPAGHTFLSPAQAADRGAGHVYGGVFVGAYLTTSTHLNAYCAEPDGDNPTAELAPKLMSSLRGYRMQSTGHWVAPYDNPAGLMLMNYISSMYGGVAQGPGWHDDQAAAVAIAIWTIRGHSDEVVADWVANIRALAPGHVQTQVEWLLTEADKGTVQPSISAPNDPEVIWGDGDAGKILVPEGYQEIRIDAGAQFMGQAPAGVTFSSSNKVAKVVGTRAFALEFEVISGVNSPRQKEASFSGKWIKYGERWPARVWGYQPAVDDADQLLLFGGGPEEFSESGTWKHTSKSRGDQRFRPIVTTQVPTARAVAGEPFRDRVTFGVDESSGNWPAYWVDGTRKFRSVKATGTLYGPFAAPPIRSAEVPSDPAPPIVATAEVNAVRGPGTYEVEAANTGAAASGYYSWVWQITGMNQGPEIQVGEADQWYIEHHYLFQDAFGIPDETQFRAMNLAVETELDDEELAPGGKTLDKITVISAGDMWFEREGQPVPVAVRVTVFETDGEPVRGPEAPPESRILSTELVTVTGIESTTTVEVVAPLTDEKGKAINGPSGVTVQTCILAEDQIEEVKDLVEEYCDDWGIPEESARVTPPKVATIAQQTGEVDGTITDIAMVEGLIPEQATLGFTAYLKAEVGEPRFDENWKPVLTADGKPLLWTDADFAGIDADARCEVQPVARTPRVSVSEAGRVTSPAVTARTEGTIYWAEDLAVPIAESDELLELHRGKCGLAVETTLVTAPPVEQSVPASEPDHNSEIEAAAELPQTGAAGTMMATAVGALLIVIGGVGLVARRASRDRMRH